MKIRIGMQLAAVLLLGTLACAQEAPKAELNFDYSWARINPTANYTQYHGLNGGGGGIKFNMGQVFGLKMDLQGYNSNTVAFSIPKTANFPNGASGTVSGNMFTYLFGPEMKVRVRGVHPYFNVLLGGAHSSVYGEAFKTICQPIAGRCVASSSPSGDAFAVSPGIGFDIPINQKIDFRVGEFSYLYTRFTNAFSDAGQNNFRYVGGLNIKMGLPPLKNPALACVAEPSEILPWAGPVKVTSSATDFNPKHSLTYGWESSGGTAVPQESSATVNTEQLAPGQYTVRGHATDPKQKKNNIATCTASFTIRQPSAPVVACSATPASVKPGEPVSVTVSGSSPDKSVVDKRTFSASSGTVKEGETQRGGQPGEFTTTATLDTSNAPPGQVSVNVGVTDEHGQSATCVASAEIVAPAPPPPPPTPTAQVVGKCDFKDNRRVTRVDNECKATLDGVALQLQREAGSKLIIVGYADSTDTMKQVESIRAANVRDYMTKGEGKQQIDATRIQIRKATDQSYGRIAQLYFVPQDAVVQLDNTDTIDESTLPTKRAGLSTNR